MNVVAFQFTLDRHGSKIASASNSAQGAFQFTLDRHGSKMMTQID